MRNRLAISWLCVVILCAGCHKPNNKKRSLLFSVNENGKWGLIDLSGKMVVAPRFDDIRGSATDRVTARGPEGWLLIYARDNIETAPLACDRDAEVVCDIGEGLYAMVSAEGASKIYDPEGRFAVQCDEYMGFGVFRDGLLPIKQGGKWGVVNRDGHVVVKPVYENVANFFEGKAAVKLEDKWGYIDRAGNLIIKPTFKVATHFSEGLAVVYIGGLFRYINADGSSAFPRGFPAASMFVKGLAAVKDPRTQLFGYIDRTGNYVIAPQYKSARYFSDGLAAVTYATGRNKQNNEEMGYIDHKGVMVIRIPDAERLLSFRQGLALIRTEQWMGYIDKQGHWVWKTDKPWIPSWEQVLGGL